jgi:hypothetical protein
MTRARRSNRANERQVALFPVNNVSTAMSASKELLKAPGRPTWARTGRSRIWPEWEFPGDRARNQTLD